MAMNTTGRKSERVVHHGANMGRWQASPTQAMSLSRGLTRCCSIYIYTNCSRGHKSSSPCAWRCQRPHPCATNQTLWVARYQYYQVPNYLSTKVLRSNRAGTVQSVHRYSKNKGCGITVSNKVVHRKILDESIVMAIDKTKTRNRIPF
jgi:hypothetical protein